MPLKAKHIPVAALMRTLVYFAQRLDDEEAFEYGAALGRAAQRVFSSRARIADENLRQAFPEMTAERRGEITRGVFEGLGRTLFEVARFPIYGHQRLRAIMRVRDSERIETVAQRGRGCMFITPHFGNWEMIGSWLPAHGYPTSFLAGRQTNPLVDRLWNDLRRSVGVNVIPTGASARPVLAALKRGEFIGIVPDQHSAIGHEIVRFFGREVAAHRGPALFAYRTGAAIVMGFLSRTGPGRHEGWVEEPLFADQSAPEASELHRLTQAIMTRFESAIRKHPEMWMWTHRRWKPVLGADSARN